MIATLKTWFETTKGLLKKPRTLAIFAVLYAVLLASVYGFVSTREATVWQVAVTFLFLVLIPLEFFVLQSAIVTHALEGKFQWGRILGTALKLAVITIPIALIGYGLWVLLNKWQLRFFPPSPATLVFPTPPGAPKPGPIHWPTMLFSTLRGLLFGVGFPLATIHLWIEIAGDDLRVLVSGGAGTVFKRIGNVFARAFAPDSVLTYALGLLLFVAVPYAVLFVVPFTVKGTKTAFAFFIARLVLAFVFTLIGWIATVGALAGIKDSAPAVVAPGEIQAQAAV